jgi:phage terminase large subunit
MGLIASLYEPRRWFYEFHRRHQRWSILVEHRRAGKTVAAVNDLLEKATYNPRPNPRYGYIAPLYNQAKQIAWTYLKEYAAPFKPKISESGLFVELGLPSAPRITLYGADNPDAFRGLYFDGAVLDEFGNMRGSIFTEVLLPALIDRRGWTVFMGTPNGPNHFRDLWYDHLEDPEWFLDMNKVTDTNIIPPEELEMMRRLMSEDEFEQEMMCSFEASTRGAFYTREIKNARAENRIGSYPADRRLPIHFVFDLGYRDDNPFWCWQEAPDGHRLVKCESWNTRPIAFYIDRIREVCAELGCPRGNVWLPHDARAKTLQTGRSIVEQFVARGIRPKIVPNLDLMDGIQAARQQFEFCHFDEIPTEPGVRALMSYHREYDEDKKAFRDNPEHDWSSHIADAFRYFALVAKKYTRIEERAAPGAIEHYPFSLNDLWGTRNNLRTRRRI